MTNATDTARFDPMFRLGGDTPVPRLGYGAMRLAGPGVIGLPDDPDDAIAVLRRAVEIGIRFFDTANAYGPRTVNQLIGRALSPVGDDIIIGNKVGATRGPRGEWLTDSRPATIRTQVEEALRDLRTERSGLTYLRLAGDSGGRAGSITEEIPLEDSLGALIELHQKGMIARIGISGATPEILARAQQIAPIVAVQNRYNLIDRSGVEVLAACEHDGVAFVPYFPLATGGLGSVDALREPARRLAVPKSTVALAWLLRRSPVIIPIPGTTSRAHLDENQLAAAVAPQLTDLEVQALTATEDEGSASLSMMPERMLDALQRPSRTHTRP